MTHITISNGVREKERGTIENTYYTFIIKLYYFFKYSSPITRKYPERISITLISIKTIVLIMPTTITINERTKERLSDYKFGDWTFDDVINMLMNKVSIEDISAEHIKEHYRRLANFKGISKEEFKSRIKKTT
jgi:hypothetical protein